MRRDEMPGRIVTNLCTGVGVHDVITCADLYYDRLRDLGVVGGQILAFSIDLLRRALTTLSHGNRTTVRVCDCRCIYNTHKLNSFLSLEVFRNDTVEQGRACVSP